MKIIGFIPGIRGKSQVFRAQYITVFYRILLKLKKVQSAEEAVLLKIQVLALASVLKKKDKVVFKSLSGLIVLLSRQINEKLKEFDDAKGFIYVYEDDRA